MNASIPAALTVATIASRDHVERHCVEYVIRRLNITPAFRAGNSRIFTEIDAERIAGELRRIKVEREISAQ